MKKKCEIRKNIKDFEEYLLANGKYFNIMDVFDEVKSILKYSKY